MLPSSGKSSTVVKTELFCFFSKTSLEVNEKCNFPVNEGKKLSINDSQLGETKIFNEVFTVLNNFHINNSTFVSPIHTFSLAGSIIVYKLIQCT